MTTMPSLRTVGLIAGTVTLLGAATAAGINRDRDMNEIGAYAIGSLIDPAKAATLICGPGKASGSAPSPAGTRVMMAAAQAAAGALPSTGQTLWQGLGPYSIAISTARDLAQRYFDQGLRLNYGFNHAEAVRAFRTAQAIDPECAMCYWGEALSLGPNINAPMEMAAVAPAVAAIAKAAALAERASPKGRALIAALTLRYAPDPGSDRSSLDRAYADAMRDVARAHPDDDEIQVLFAEALMDLQPWDYWHADGRTGKGNTDEIVATIERVLERAPDHAAAIHLYIHMVEASSTPERAKPFADRLAAQMPAAGHIVHMPSHIYYRLGLWKESIDANIAAVKADEAYLADTDVSGMYPYGYFPHNIHFVVASAQMAGAGDVAIEYAEKLARTIPPEAAAIPGVQPIVAAPYFAHVMFSAPETVLGIAAPASDLPLVRALWHYARAEAEIARGDIAAASREREALRTIATTDAVKALEQAYVPGPAILAIADAVLRGRLAMHAKDYGEAVDAFETAAGLQDSLPYMEPPFWYYPVRQSLGAALLRAGRTDDAISAFRGALNDSPNNGWAIHGLAEAYAAAGDDAAARTARDILDRTWLGDRRPPAVDRL